MKILYKQSSVKINNNALAGMGVENCYLKEIMYVNDYKITTLNTHSHTEYEIHMVFCGKQCYEIDGSLYEVGENEFIIIPPGLKHSIAFASENLSKYSITFNLNDGVGYSAYLGEINDDIINSINFISNEFRQKRREAYVLIENRVFEILVLLFRILGYKGKNDSAEMQTTDDRFNLAKKFILDNIEQNLSVADVASYCHISTRQLTRIFFDVEGSSPAKYISDRKMEKICHLLINTDLTLRQISEKFSYNNEYYFNSAFKKHFGMPPMAYRKTFR